jgi:endonuclease/exonuclease/phosphatase (EEP) superfamily protein YafD
MIRSFGLFVVAVATVLLAVATVLPLVQTQWWAARLLDFPRLYWAGGLVACLVGSFGLLRAFRRSALALICLAAVALAINVTILWPYRPGVAARDEACPAEQRLSVLIANVQLGNRTSETLLAAVQAAEPDLFLAMETDGWWADALAPLRRSMPHMVQELTGSYYGIQLYSRLPLSDATIRYLAGQSTPSVVAGVRLRSGEIVDFLGVHPRPPQVFQSALGRDAELYAAAEILRAKVEPGILAGDLNATPWEEAVGRMRRLADLTDPREGYGYIATWNAATAWVRWPLDQIFHEGGFRTVSVERLAAIGSDHFPYLARLCRVPAAGRTGTPPRASDLDAANAVLSAAGASIRLR